MDLFHIKVIEKPNKFFSVVYSVKPNLCDSHFVKVENYKRYLDQPGKNPQWIEKALEIQKKNLDLARKYVFSKMKQANQRKNYYISVGFEWDQTNYQHDEFMKDMFSLVGFD